MTLLTGHRRRTYTFGPTPLHRLPRLEGWLGGRARLWIKRDDRTGLALGGNKTRKLEFLVHDALERECDTLVTCGAVQSNHCRLTAAAANVEGLGCHLVLGEKAPGQYDPRASGNNLLYRLLGATVHPRTPGADLDVAMADVAAALRERGRAPYVIPMGGSNALGALGYVACAEELLAQCAAMDLRPHAVVCATSSGGTHAGLAVGLAPAEVEVHGICVDGDLAQQERRVRNLVALASAAIGRDPPPDPILLDAGYIGPGYAQPSPEMVEAVRAFARLEGIVLDPVYTGKAAAGLIGRVRQGRYDDRDVVFVHTGGTPALFANPHPAVPRPPE